MASAEEITLRAKSNLAFALRVVPRHQRKDVTTFYAFCRVVDDIADDPSAFPEDKTSRLARWSAVIRRDVPPSGELESRMVEMMKRREIPVRLLEAVIKGCRSDILPRRFTTWEELDDYIWHVAGAVGLVSVRLFACTDPRCDDYAVALGKALQLTNILRDIREDYENGGRIYLPAEALAEHGVTPSDLAKGTGSGFFTLLQQAADRAEASFVRAAALMPSAERKNLRSAVIMGGIYRALLRKMRADGFRVAEKRYRLAKPALLLILVRHLVAPTFRIE